MIKEKVKTQKRSLNNYIEYLLYKDVGDIPTELTRRAIEDADLNTNVTTIDDLKAYKQSLIDGNV